MEARPMDFSTRWMPWLLGAAAAAILFFATQPFGIGVTSDCVDYFSTAANLASGEGFLQHDGNPYASWPPLYPMLLAAGLKVGLSCEITALLINLLSVGLLLFFLSRWMFINLQHRFVAHWASLVILLHFALLDVALHAWTEPIFNLLVMVFLLRLPFVAKRKSWGALVWLAILAAAIWSLRYVGITVVAVGGIFILLSGELTWPRRLRRTVVFGMIAALPTLVWLIRNLQVMGQVAGERSPSSFGLFQNLRFTVKHLAWWILHESWGPVIPSLLLAVLLSILLYIRWSRRKTETHARILTVLECFIALNLAFLIYTSSRYAFEAIHSRYILPVFLPLLLWVALLIDRLFDGWKRRLWPTLTAVLMIAWLIWPAAQSLARIMRARHIGIDTFSALDYQGWALWNWLEGSPEEAIYISNGADAVHYHTGLPVRLAPRRWIHSTSRTETTELSDFAAIFEEDRPVFYIWISDFPRTGARMNYHSLEELLELYRLEPIVAFPESAVFMVMPRK